MAEQKSIGSISVIGVCIVIVIGLQVATLHRLHFESYDTDGSQPRSSARVKLPLQDELLQRFPGLFQTEADIMKRNSMWFNLTRAELHTCGCDVESGFKPLTTAIDSHGSNRTLLQFKDQKQYFYTEACLKHHAGSRCYCASEDIVSLALYVIGDKWNITYFYTGTLCRNLNV